MDSLIQKIVSSLALFIYIWAFVGSHGEMWLAGPAMRRMSQVQHIHPSPTRMRTIPSVIEIVLHAPSAQAGPEWWAWFLTRDFWDGVLIIAFVVWLVLKGCRGVGRAGDGAMTQSSGTAEQVSDTTRRQPSEIVKLRWRLMAHRGLAASKQQTRLRWGCVREYVLALAQDKRVAAVRDRHEQALDEETRKNKLLKTGLAQAWKKVEEHKKARGEAEKMVQDLKDKVSTMEKEAARTAELIDDFLVAQDEQRALADKAAKDAYGKGWNAGYWEESERSKEERNRAYEQGAIEETCVLSRDLDAANKVLEETQYRVRILRKIVFKTMAGSNRSLEGMRARIRILQVLLLKTMMMLASRPSTIQHGEETGTATGAAADNGVSGAASEQR
ncbi:MAG: hypothetical protein Q9202_004279 [Teloschistes flavicans]